jgi:hypothetical protein
MIKLKFKNTNEMEARHLKCHFLLFKKKIDWRHNYN